MAAAALFVFNLPAPWQALVALVALLADWIIKDNENDIKKAIRNALSPFNRCAFGNVCFNVCSCPQKPDQLQTEGQENKIMKGHTFGKEKAEGEIIHKITK